MQQHRGIRPGMKQTFILDVSLFSQAAIIEYPIKNPFPAAATKGGSIPLFTQFHG
jgi:hypothetical protein